MSIDTLNVSIAVDCFEGRDVATADIEGAYLIVNMEDQEVYVVLDPILTSLIISLQPDLEELVDEDGCLHALLGRALYGCIQSAKLFFEHLSSTFRGIGFVGNAYDPCIMNKVVNGTQVTVTIYVDDVKISSKDSNLVTEVLKELTKVYKTLSVKRGPVIEYLGIDVDYSVKGQARLSMEKMTKNIVNEYNFDNGDVKGANSPSTNQLFHQATSEDLSKSLDDIGAANFHSLVAKLLYLAKRTRPDILTTVSYLTTRVRDPTRDDEKKLERLMKYLRGNTNLGRCVAWSAYRRQRSHRCSHHVRTRMSLRSFEEAEARWKKFN